MTNVTFPPLFINFLSADLGVSGFYLILDVGVGGTNGWFPDGPEKPWLNGSPSTVLLSISHKLN